MLGKIEGRRRRGWQSMRCWMASLTQWIWVWVNSGSGEGQGGQACCGSWGCKESDMTEWLNWTESFSTALHLVFPSDWQEGKRPSLNLLPWRVLMTFCPSLIRRFGSKLMKPFHPIWSLQPLSIKSLLLPWETWWYFQIVYHTLEKEMTTHSSILAWRIPWTEEPDGLQSLGCKEWDTTEWLSTQARGRWCHFSDLSWNSFQR